MRILFLLAATLVAAAQNTSPGVPAGTPEQRTRAALDLFLGGQYDAVYEFFAPAMRDALTPEAWRASGKQMAALGKPEKIGEATSRKVGDLVIVTIPVNWQSVTLEFSATWDKQDHIAGCWFRPPAVTWQPPPYAKADSFDEKEYQFGADAWRLTGILATPKGKGPFPVVVLVHGSGPQDRDETIGGLKVFKDLTFGLASRGIAVFRYDKRTRVYGGRMQRLPDLTMNEETVDDAVAAAEFVRKQAGIDAKRVFVLGHSQGGYMLPRIAKRVPGLAGVISMAGNVRHLEDLVIEQSEYLASLKGEVSAEERQQLDQLRQQAAALKKATPGMANPPSMLGLPPGYLMDLKDYDPAALMKSIPVPILVLQGERDYQVTMVDYGLWRKALEGRKDAGFHTYPKLNHLFVAGEGKSVPAEYQKPGHVAVEVIDDVANWIGGVRP